MTAHLSKIETADYGSYLVKEARGPARYYTREAACRWVGRGAARHFGRSGEATEEEVENVLSRRAPDGRLLGLKSGAKYRPGFDLCVDDDKSLSLIRFLGPEEAGAVISRCRKEAADHMFRYAEDHLAWTRRGQGGKVREQLEGFIAFCAAHDRSREDDMHEHFHYGIANYQQGADGIWRTLDTKPLWDNQLCLSAIHQQHLSYLLERELGLVTKRATKTVYENGEKVTREMNWFTCPDVAPEACEHFSKRRKQILSDMEARGAAGAREAKRSGETTRKEKDYSLTTEGLVPRWKEEAEARFGLSEEVIREMFGKAPERSEPLAERLDRAIRAGGKALSEKQAHFSKHDLVRYAATEAISQGIPAPLLIAAVEERLGQSEEFVRRGAHPRDVRYSTRENYELEQQLLRTAGRLHARTGHAVSQTDLQRVLGQTRWKTIKDEQRTAVERITTGSDLALVTGMAGAGKSYMLGCARAVWEADPRGLKVIGAAFTGRAGVLLEKEAGIKTSTIHRLLQDLDSGIKEEFQPHGKPTHAGEKLALDASTVLVVDECGQVPTALLKRVLDHVERAGGRAVLVGDARQVQPIAPGGPFKSMTERFGQSTSTLRDVRRQQQAWQIEAVHCFADGDAQRGLALFRQHDCLTVTQGAADTLRQMVDDWANAGGVEDPEKHFLLATTRADVARLNRLAQQKRREGRLLPAPRYVEDGEDRIYEGDRVMLGRNYTAREQGPGRPERRPTMRKVSNGDLATVLRIDLAKDAITLAVDGQEKPLTLSLKSYNRFGPAIHLGFAATVYKSQGSSLSHVYAQAGADRELSYVATSRHKVHCQLYATEADMDDGAEDLIRTMNKSHQKDLFLDVPHQGTGQFPELSPEP